jgi:plastocyanin
MKTFGFLRLSILVLSVRALAADATIEGRVALPPPATAPMMNQRYEVVTHGTTVATDPPLAVVYLEGNFPRPAVARTVQLPQKDMAFVPSLLPIQVGTRVEFPNMDDTFHNVYSFSKTKRFDLGRYRLNDQPVPAQVFDQAGLVVLRCEIHEHMRGLILVLDTPYFVVTGADGRFRLTGLLAGRYTLKAWIDSESTRGQAVELAPGATVHIDFP